jgi:hypothetical protein
MPVNPSALKCSTDNCADLLIKQGSNYGATVWVENLDGTPADLTNYTGARAQIRRGPADVADVECEITCTIILPDQVRLSIDKALTIGLCGRYEWELDLLPDDLAILGGEAVVAAEVTREVVLVRK